ncbi:MAG: hypothetical protein MET45_06205 [Nostoc sp. LLA-1]|nr:hypothetical protein [Cyanocohniella sp. LLY]
MDKGTLLFEMLRERQAQCGARGHFDKLSAVQREKDQEDVVLDVETKKFISSFWEISRQSANTV